MPIIKPSKNITPVFFPTSNHKLFRYIDITKFISLLSKKSLFFSRLDKLEDHLEGTTSKLNFEIRKERERNLHQFFKNLEEPTEKEILERVKQHYIDDEKQKSLICVNSWNIANFESAALWKIYASFNRGILITSSVEKLQKALENTKENINISEIKYIDFNNEYMPEGSILYPAIYKHQVYSIEKELRLIYTVDFKGGLVYDWEKEEISYGKYIKIDIKTLISEIILSPYSPEWFLELIQEQCTMYGLDVKVKKSEFSKN